MAKINGHGSSGIIFDYFEKWSQEETLKECWSCGNPYTPSEIATGECSYCSNKIF